MLWIRFGPEDMARVRFSISPLGETILSVAVLGRHPRQLPLEGWRSQQRRNLAGAPSRVLLGLVPADWRPTLALAPIVGERPLFEEELEAVVEFRPRPLQAFLATLGSPARTARWMPRLPDDARSERRLARDLLRDYHSRCITEHWPAVRLHLEADIAYRTGIRAAQGIGRVLATLHPAVRWNDPILEVDVAGGSRSIDLGGRGLVLVPSVFAWPNPIVLLDGTGQPVLLYPARRLLALWHGPASDRDVLAALLGGTRAAVLLAATRGDSTSDLADRLDVSVASASQHLTALRNAGLVAGTRRGRAVHHDLTPLGVQLLLASGRFTYAQKVTVTPVADGTRMLEAAERPRQ
jgi:DNA-binding transcriptional ArsR family regulator